MSPGSTAICNSTPALSQLFQLLMVRCFIQHQSMVGMFYSLALLSVSPHQATTKQVVLTLFFKLVRPQLLAQLWLSIVQVWELLLQVTPIAIAMWPLQVLSTL